jgi:hypothetical protein
MVRKINVDFNSVLLNKINVLHLKKKDLKAVPILDRDPILAAGFLTIKDREEALETLSHTFRYLKSPLQQNKALELNILINQRTFNWYAKFATEIDRLVNHKVTIDIPYYIVDELLVAEEYPILLMPPLKYNPQKKEVTFVFKRTRDKNPINLWRIKYISEEFEESEFSGGYPAWYVMSETTVFENYSTKTNRRIKIDFINGEFFYYIAGASDNWRRIIGVPAEMDYVVASLLFKN